MLTRGPVVATVVAGVGETVTLAAAVGGGLFDFGRLRWIDGPNAGLSAMVVTSAGATLTLREAPAFAVTGPEAVEIVEGCDRRFATCCTRFANAVNFRGEPHLPGNDLLTRYDG
ncbi:phage BR0599 family protein [Sphingomonas sp.]|uniref:phage BR0599 family protein n=1 Tax=Sphingomonas sp. TaxID=28214 RepID=UPI0025E645C9|nr:phage BR0599 family protein [Sphingomonas sp.]